MSSSKKFRHFLPALTATCIGVVALTASAAHAQARREACEDYADQAARQVEANERRHCGYEGPRWTGNRTAHFAWCMLAPRQAQEETEARKRMLEECRDDRGGERLGKRANCDTYAKIAVVQAEANQKYNCNLRGGEWNRDEGDHFRWCMRARREYLIDEMRYRATELQKCFNTLGDYDEQGDDRDYKRRRF